MANRVVLMALCVGLLLVQLASCKHLRSLNPGETTPQDEKCVGGARERRAVHVESEETGVDSVDTGLSVESVELTLVGMDAMNGQQLPHGVPYHLENTVTDIVQCHATRSYSNEKLQLTIYS
ncbi:unnamed protein product [Lampetra planeri]